MKSTLIALTLILIATAFSSCADDDNSKSDSPIANPKEVNPYITKTGTTYGKPTRTGLSTSEELETHLRIVIQSDGTAEIAVGVFMGGGVMRQLTFLAQELKWTLSEGHIYFEDQAKIRLDDLVFIANGEKYKEFSGQKLEARELFEDFTLVP